MLVTKTRRVAVEARKEVIREFLGTFLPYPNQSTVTDPSHRVVRTLNDSRLTYNSPSYKWRIRNNLNATGSLDGTRKKLEGASGALFSVQDNLPNSPSWYRDTTVYRGTYCYDCSGEIPPSPLSYSDSKADNQALQRFYQDARQAQTTLQGLVTLGELGETLRGINSVANGVYRGLWNYVRALRKGNVLQVLRQLSRKGKTQFLADRWLETQLFINPLLNDIDNLAETLGTARSSLLENIRVHGFGEVEAAAHLSNRTFQWIQHGIKQQEKYQVIYYGLVRLEDSYAGIPSLSRWGMDSSNWLPSLWELIPYSWVADYFTNIGDLLSAWSFYRASICWASKTTRRSTFLETYNPRVIVADTANAKYRTSPGFMRYEQTRTLRGALDQVPIPSLEFRIPGLSMQWLNLAALFGASRSVQRIID
jgi:hypothetical protein